MRSLKALDTEITKHRLLFGREAEQRELCDQLTNARGVMVHGLGGMGKTTLMVHSLMSLGGVPSDGRPVSEAGHALYFEDLETFALFLGVRSKPVTAAGATVVIKWDQDGERKERIVTLRAGRGADPARGLSFTGSSSVLQTDRIMVEARLDAVVEPRFEDAEVSKLAGASLSTLAERLADSIADSRRGTEYSLDGPPEHRKDVPERIAALIAELMDGSVDETDRRYGIILNFLEERIGQLVEDLNKLVYLSVGQFVRAVRGARRRISLYEFEEELTGFLDNANMDRLVPGDSTFWRWYLGIDHLERGAFGWTLDIRRQAVRMLYERLMEKEGLHLVTALDGDPRVLFPLVDIDKGMGGFDRETKVHLLPLGMPSRDAFVRDASSYILVKVEELNGLNRSEVPQLIGQMYDRSRDQLRLYFMVRQIRNLGDLNGEGMAILPETSFLDRQVSDALTHLGLYYEYDQSIENIPAVQPILVLALGRDGGPSVDGLSKNAMSWLLDAHEGGRPVEFDRYLEVMEMYDLLTTTGDRVRLFHPYVDWEFRCLATGKAASPIPLVRTLQAHHRFTEFIRSLSVEDLIDLTGYFITSISGSGTFRPDLGPFDLLLGEADQGGEDRDRKEKVSLLLALSILNSVPFSAGIEKVQVHRCAELFLEMMDRGNRASTSFMSRALARLMSDGTRTCVRCGFDLERGHCLCARCRADYRPVCGDCGTRNSTLFAFCSGCGAKLSEVQ
jgi:hypothetical protein